MGFLCLILLVIIILKQANCDYSELRPPEIFPEEYDKYVPPWKRGSPAHVYLQLSIMDVDKIDDGAMEFSLQSYLGEFWKDTRLNLTSYIQNTDTNPIFPTYLTKYLWIPDLVFDNTKNGMLFHLSLPNTNIKVLKDGYFLKSSRYNLIVGCHMDFRFYPMDTQKCFLKIATISSPDLKVLLHWIEKHSPGTMKVSNPDFKVLLHWIEENPPGKMKSIPLMYNIQPLKYVLRNPQSYKSTEVWTSGNYTYLYANFTFVRRISGSLFNVYVPSTLVVFLSWISFWLDVEAVPARVTLGVTSLLTLATQVVQAHVGLPAISYMTAMDVWLFACLITVFSSLIEFAFSYQLFVLSKQRQSGSNEISKQVKVKMAKDEIRVLRSRLGEELSMRNVNHGRSNSVASEKLPKTLPDQKSLDKICRRVFPFLFFTFAAVYWAYYLYLK